MATPILVPQLGKSATTGTIVKWLKRRGDAVRLGEAVLEIETDKVTMEVLAPTGGRLSETSARAGSSVAVGAQVGLIDETQMDSKFENPSRGQAIERSKSWLQRLFGH
jgi:2-oxoglutarate dehydrogenase E2 component (dihydrolipoamide succinyltransferase)